MTLTTSPVCRLPTGYLSATFCPRAGRLLLQAEGDLLRVLVDLEDVDLELLVDLDHLVRVVDAAPAHVGDVQQAVDAAEVDERAEVGDVLDDALADLARLDLGEQLLLQLVALVFDQLAAADDDVAARLVDLEDLALDGACRCSRAMSGGRRMSTWLAGRKTLTPMLTSRPPLILRVTRPETTSPSLCLEMTSSHSFCRLALR